MAEIFRINASTRADRHQTIDRAQAAIESSDGWLIDFRPFSNISICFNVEIKRRDIHRLFAALGDIGLGPGAAAHYDPGIDPDETIKGTIQITFIHDQPDLRIEIPEVPG